jgi:hypothetical protein
VERLLITSGAWRLGFAVFFLGFSAITHESTISPHVRRCGRRLTTKWGLPRLAVKRTRESA